MEEENSYFLLHLKLPVYTNESKSIIRTNMRESGQEYDEISVVPSSVFIQVLENAYGCDLRKNNPWLHSNTRQKFEIKKRVRFSIL